MVREMTKDLSRRRGALGLRDRLRGRTGEVSDARPNGEGKSTHSACSPRNHRSNGWIGELRRLPDVAGDPMGQSGEQRGVPGRRRRRGPREPHISNPARQVGGRPETTAKSRIAEIVDSIGLWISSIRPVGSYSGGEGGGSRSGAGLGCPTRVLFRDEPTSVSSRASVRAARCVNHQRDCEAKSDMTIMLHDPLLGRGRRSLRSGAIVHSGRIAPISRPSKPCGAARHFGS